jgi:hypothetical protein
MLVPVQFMFESREPGAAKSISIRHIENKSTVDVSSALPEAELPGLVTYPPVLHLI